MTQAGRNLYTSPLALFEAPVFHPLRHALAYSESMLSAGVFVGPLGWLCGNPILAYNLYNLATIVLSVVGMYLLVREITGDGRAGLVAAGLFGLATERGLWWEFPPALALHWAPVLLWSWLRFLAGPSWRRGLGLGLALLAHMHAAAYHGLMLPALLVPWALVLAAFGPWPVRRWVASALPIAVAGGVAAALYYPYLVAGEELQYEPTGLAFALPEQYAQGIGHPLEYVAWRIFRPEAGFLVSPLAWYLLAAAAIAAVSRRRLRAPATPRLGAQLAAALILTVLAILVSCGVVLMTPFGLVPGPLALLRALPGFAAMRAVVRFMMLATVGRSIVAGIAMAILLRRLPATAGRMAAIAVLVLAAADARLWTPRSVHDVTVPAAWAKGYAWLAGTLPDTAIVEIPYGTFGGDAHYMVYGLSHRRRIMNGYAASPPRFVDSVARLPEDVAWRTLQEAGVQYVLVHPSLLEAHPLTAPQVPRLLQRRDLVVASFDDTLVLAVPPPMRPPDPPLGDPLPRDGWRIEASTPGVERTIDGDLGTHWQANSLKTDATLRLDLGREVELAGIVLELGPHLLEYPRRYEVRASNDALAWTTIGAESPTIPPFASYRRDHRHLALRLRIAPARARWIELVVAAYPVNAWSYTNGRWGIHELQVFATRPERVALAAAPAVEIW